MTTQTRRPKLARSRARPHVRPIESGDAASATVPIVRVDSCVTVQDALGRTQTFVVVPALRKRAPAQHGGVPTTCTYISLASPVAAALLRHGVGDTVDVSVPAGVRRLTLLAVVPASRD